MYKIHIVAENELLTSFNLEFLPRIGETIRLRRIPSNAHLEDARPFVPEDTRPFLYFFKVENIEHVIDHEQVTATDKYINTFIYVTFEDNDGLIHAEWGL
ncbi:MAG: hypothetical protein LC687_02225 [Actinobacteria bacterium]|nr:hypothetical protein [Actinomycetota bacterium]